MAIRGKSGKAAKSPASTAGKAPGEARDVIETVRSLAEILNEHGLSELIVDLPDATLTLRRGVTGAVLAAGHAPAHVVHAHAPAPPALPPAPHHLGNTPPPPPAADDKSHVVTSPFVGTFYKRPNPDAAAYVNQGDKVGKGQVLCIVEAMKLMNEIEADIAGTLVAILVEDGQPVEYGQALFRILP
jgi:acetyl-CoA carboxylase biotin carboxyl carrier protein